MNILTITLVILGGLAIAILFGALAAFIEIKLDERV